MKIIFVCTGNTCRSPLAESYAKSIAPQHDFASRGIGAFDGSSISSYSQELINRDQLPEVTSSASFKQEDADADLILTMSESHAAMLRSFYPGSNVHTLKSFAGSSGDIDDPYGGHFSDYEQAYEEIKRYVERAIRKIDDIQ